MALYAGDALQGKSRLSAAVSAMIAAALEQMPPPENVNPEEWDQQNPKQFTVRTIGMQDFTPLRTVRSVFWRVDGLHASTMVNLDEAYSFLGKIGLTAGGRAWRPLQGNCSVRTRFLLEHAIGYRQNSARH